MVWLTPFVIFALVVVVVVVVVVVDDVVAGVVVFFFFRNYEIGRLENTGINY